MEENSCGIGFFILQEFFCFVASKCCVKNHGKE